MPQVSDSGQTKHYKGFWPLFIILTIGATAAIVVYWFQVQLVTDYDTNSTEIRIHRRKSPVKSTTTKSTTTQTKNTIPQPVNQAK